MRRILITPYVLTIASQYSNHIKSENIIGKLNNLKQTLLPQPNSVTIQRIGNRVDLG